MASVFTKIVKGELPAYKVAEDERFLAFLDINPLSKGHTLVIPKEEIDYIFDLPEELYRDLWLFARRVARAIEKVVECERIGIAVVGLEVPHAHIHLIPINSVADMNFAKPRVKMSEQEFKSLAEQISKAYQELFG